MLANPNSPTRHYYSLEEYFALEHAGDARYEYWRGDIYCMSGGTPEHGIISSNVVVTLGNSLRGGPCRVFTADTAILTPSLPPYRYADASVACGELKFKTIQGVGALANPVLIVEVLSPTTAARDHEEKFAIYRGIETFQEYLLISQEEAHVVQYQRQQDGTWKRRDHTDLRSVLQLDSLGCQLRLEDIYDGVDLARQ